MSDLSWQAFVQQTLIDARLFGDVIVGEVLLEFAVELTAQSSV